MKIDVVTIFPEFFTTPLATSMVARAVDKKLVEIALHDLRNFATDRHRSVDAAPFGGGGGMVLKPEPVTAALETEDLRRGHCVYLTADGVPLDVVLLPMFLPYGEWGLKYRQRLQIGNTTHQKRLQRNSQK